MVLEEFNAKYERISKEIESLRAEKRKLCEVMSEEHPINRLKGKLVSVRGGEPMFFDHLDISPDCNYLVTTTVVGYALKKDGSISKSLRTHYVSIDTVEQEIEEVDR